MNKPRLRILCLFGILTAMIGSTVNAQVYKWVDEEGNVHFSDQPPAEAEVEQVDTSSSELSSDQIAEAQARAQKTQASQVARRESEASERTERSEKLAEQRQEDNQRNAACAIAEQQLGVLERSRPVYQTNQDGERVFTDDETREARSKDFQQFIRNNC